jgi:hypothetical protein
MRNIDALEPTQGESVRCCRGCIDLKGSAWINVYTRTW